MSECKALQTVKKYKKFSDLVDFFEDHEYTYMVVKQAECTLLEHVSSYGNPHMPIDQVAFIVKNIAKGLKKIHSKMIIHRHLTLEAI